MTEIYLHSIRALRIIWKRTRTWYMHATQLALFALGQMAQIKNLDVVVELHNAVRAVNTVECADAPIVRPSDDDNRGVLLL